VRDRDIPVPALRFKNCKSTPIFCLNNPTQEIPILLAVFASPTPGGVIPLLYEY
jgi:hypothetical protein